MLDSCDGISGPSEHLLFVVLRPLFSSCGQCSYQAMATAWNRALYLLVDAGVDEGDMTPKLSRHLQE